MCSELISGYMVKHLGFKPEEVADKATELYIKYGTTLAGLVVRSQE
jgi:hypothetical protein